MYTAKMFRTFIEVAKFPTESWETIRSCFFDLVEWHVYSIYRNLVSKLKTPKFLFEEKTKVSTEYYYTPYDSFLLFMHTKIRHV